MPTPDWEKLETIARHAQELNRAHAIDRETWRALLDEACVAANGRPDLTGFLAPYAQSEWLRELRDEDRATHRSLA
jgi:hypothetical protein